MNHIRPLALALTLTLLGVWACPAPASDGVDAPMAQASKKKSCKKKGAKSTTALAGVRKKKCKAPGNPTETPLSVTITSCPSGVISGSNVATISGTSAVGPGVTTYLTYNLADDYLGALVLQEVRVYPNASGAWTHSFTPGFPDSWEATESWDQAVTAANYHAHDAEYARCSWTVAR